MNRFLKLICACAVVSCLASTAWGAKKPHIVYPPLPPAPAQPPDLGINADLHGKHVFPGDNLWNTPIDHDPVDPMSNAIIARMAYGGAHLHASFGAELNGSPFGIGYEVVPTGQQRIPVVFQKSDQSDGGDYPIPGDVPIEHVANGTGDRRAIVIDREDWRAYELNGAYFEMEGWRAYSGAIFDLNSNDLRPDGWMSADNAGLCVFAGLVRYDEVTRGEINHALRFTVAETRKAYMLPARHYSARKKDVDLPPMGMRVRLKASYDISHFPKTTQVILRCLKKYGMIVADNGDDWGISGTADSRWNDLALEALQQVKPTDFEVVEMHNITVK
ncbi:MAG: hypothetical protein ACLQVD_19880 [Capsulimonadaceae bacterium]